MLKRLLSATANHPAFAAFVSLLERADGEPPNLLRVLTYHRVDEPEVQPRLSPALNSATPAAFARQMEYLAVHFHVISAAELVEAYQQRKPLPSRAVMVTFDDAYGDFQDHAWPVLKRLRLPVTLFVPTSFPDHLECPFWWDRLFDAVNSTSRERIDSPLGRLPLITPAERMAAYKKLRTYVKSLPHTDAMAWVEEACANLGAPPGVHYVLGWDALRRLAQEGVTLGAHTRTHPMMNRISIEDMRAEAVGSLRQLEQEIGPVLPIFAYPSGGFNDQAVGVLKEEGFLLAFTTIRGLNRVPADDPLRLRRVNVGRMTSLAAMRAQLAPLARHLNRVWSRSDL